MGVHTSAIAGYSEAAAAYVKGRPEYPPQVEQWLRIELGIAPGHRVLDLGAGTGKFSRKLLSAGATVVAVDPVSAMLAQLRHRFPQVETRQGSAEALPVESASLDAVVCAQSFHWFARRPALEEIRRVLKPGGRLGLIWNVRDESVEWVAALTEIIQTFEDDTPRYRTQQWRSLFPAEGFTPLQEHRFRNEHVGHPEQVIVDRMLSVSFIAALPVDKQREIAGRIRERIAETPALTGQTSVKFPYETVAVNCAKLGG